MSADHPAYIDRFRSTLRDLLSRHAWDDDRPKAEQIGDACTTIIAQAEHGHGELAAEMDRASLATWVRTQI